MKEFINTLKNSLGDCKRSETSNCRLNTSYEIFNARRFSILDDTKNDHQPVKATVDQGDYQLRVENKKGIEICVVKIDKCLIIDDRYQRCDCILFSKNKFFLVEISNAGNRNGKRRHAVEQLASTIEILKINQVDLSGHDTTAIICFRSDRTKPLRASSNTMREVFREKYNVKLEEGGKIYF